MMAIEQGQYDRAEGYWHQCLAIHESLEANNHLLAYAVDGWARVAYGRNDNIRAARLYGIAENLRETPIRDSSFPDDEALLTGLRRRLGDEAFHKHRAHGKGLSREEVLTEARRRTNRDR